MRGAGRGDDGAKIRDVSRLRTRQKLARYGSLLPLCVAIAAGCASQEEPPGDESRAGSNSGGSGGTGGSKPNGGGTTTSGSSAGGSASGGGTNGGTAAGGTATSGSNSGGSASGGGGSANGGTTGGGGASGGSAGAGGKGGSGGTGGAGGGGAGGMSGSGGSAGAMGGGGAGGMAADPCKNGKKDGVETDVDCGGNVCSTRCSTNQACALVTDCVNDAAVNGTHNVCDADKCRARGCNATNCAYDLTRFIIGTATASSARGQVFVSWDATALKLKFQVHDSTPKDDSVENWKDDSVEVYLDLNHAKSAPFDADDFQINVPRVGSPQAIGAVNLGAIVVTRSDDNTDYELNVMIPWSALNNAGSQLGKTIGFSIGLNDDSSADPERDTQVMLFGTENNYQDASQFGDLQLN